MNIYEYVLSRVCLDKRVKNGIFSATDNDHLMALQEFLVRKGVAESDAITIRNRMIEGKYPERQAYNADGLLVTFPTPEYKQNAIARGTHFEENPKKAQANIFNPPTTGVPAADTSTPTPAPAPAAPAAASLFTPEPEQKKEPETSIADAPTVDSRTPEEKKQDAAVIQNILLANPPSNDYQNKLDNIQKMQKVTDDGSAYTLEEAKKNNFYEKNGVWYNSEGQYVGVEWRCDFKNKAIILP